METVFVPVASALRSADWTAMREQPDEAGPLFNYCSRARPLSPTCPLRERRGSVLSSDARGDELTRWNKKKKEESCRVAVEEAKRTKAKRSGKRKGMMLLSDPMSSCSQEASLHKPELNVGQTTRLYFSELMNKKRQTTDSWFEEKLDAVQ